MTDEERDRILGIRPRRETSFWGGSPPSLSFYGGGPMARGAGGKMLPTAAMQPQMPPLSEDAYRSPSDIMDEIEHEQAKRDYLRTLLAIADWKGGDSNRKIENLHQRENALAKIVGFCLLKSNNLYHTVIRFSNFFIRHLVIFFYPFSAGLFMNFYLMIFE